MIIFDFKSFKYLIFSFRCTSDKVAPYALLKHTTMYNATTSNTGILDPPVYQRKPSATTKQINIKLKQKKQSKSQKSCTNGKPNTILQTSSTAQPNCLMSCNTALFKQKSNPNQSTRFPAEATSTAHPHTKTMVTTSKTITPNKRKNITQWPKATVQAKLMKRFKPLTSKLKSDPPRGNHFRLKQRKQQRGKDGKQDIASLHNTVSPNFITISLDRKLPKTNKFFESISQTKKETKLSSRKNISNAVSSRSHPKNTSTSEMASSSEINKLPKIRNNTNSAYETFKPTGKAFIFVHVYIILCSCK